LARAAKRKQEADRFEREKQVFFERIRAAYLALAAQHPNRYRVINADQTLDRVTMQLENLLAALVK
jgi:dTMP kinase